jgi:hypothetical protein
VYALIAHHYHKDANKMTEIQIQHYISQISWVVTIERIKLYLKGFLGIKEELEEDETPEERKEKDFKEIQKQAELHGIPKPKK